MYRNLLAILMAVCLIAALFAGCGGKGEDDPSNTSSLTEESDAAGAQAVLPGETQGVDSSTAADQNAGESGNANTSGGTGSSATGGNAAGAATQPSGAGTATRPAGGASGGTTAARPSGSGNSSTTKPTTTKPSGGGSSSTTTKPTTTKPTTTKPSTTKPSGGGSTQPSKADIVSYFNTAANKVKTGRPKLAYEMKLAMTFSIFGMSQSMEDSSKDTLARGSNLNDAFPVSGQSWASRLSASAVQSASRTLKDGKYTIKIVMKDENNVTNARNSAHGQAFTVLDLNDFQDAAQDKGISIQNVTNSFRGSTITCVVDAKTGNMLSASYLLKDKGSATMKDQESGVNLPVTIDLTMQMDYTMTW